MLSLLVLASGATAANNAFTYPVTAITVNAGSTLDFKWANASGSTANLILRTGDPKDLTTVQTIASNIANQGSYSWNVPSNLPEASYTVEISADGDDNYSSFFTIAGGKNATSSSAAASSAVSSRAPSSKANATASASSAKHSSAVNSSSVAPTSKASSSASKTSAKSSSKSTSAAVIGGGHHNGTAGTNGTTGTNGTSSTNGTSNTNGTGSNPSGSPSGSSVPNAGSVASFSNAALAGAVGAAAMLFI